MTTVACRYKSTLINQNQGGGNKKQGLPPTATGFWFNCCAENMSNWARATPGPNSRFVLGKANQIGGVGFRTVYQTQVPSDAPNLNGPAFRLLGNTFRNKK